MKNFVLFVTQDMQLAEDMIDHLVQRFPNHNLEMNEYVMPTEFHVSFIADEMDMAVIEATREYYGMRRAMQLAEAEMDLYTLERIKSKAGTDDMLESHISESRQLVELLKNESQAQIPNGPQSLPRMGS